jgi:hypothetical protein
LYGTHDSRVVNHTREDLAYTNARKRPLDRHPRSSGGPPRFDFEAETQNEGRKIKLSCTAHRAHLIVCGPSLPLSAPSTEVQRGRTGSTASECCHDGSHTQCFFLATNIATTSSSEPLGALALPLFLQLCLSHFLKEAILPFMHNKTPPHHTLAPPIATR